MREPKKMAGEQAIIARAISDSIATKKAVLEDPAAMSTIRTVASEIVRSLKKGGKVLFCGNGGSAADAQHLAAELCGKFCMDREPLPAEALHVNTSALTAIANDFAYDEVFSRLVRASGRKGDVLIGISTSGNSPNVIKALAAAGERGMITVGLTGAGTGGMERVCRYILRVPSAETPRIQEVHILIGHILCELVERKLFG